MPVLAQTTLPLVACNVGMTFAWYAHLRKRNGKPCWIAALSSWGIALFGCLFGCLFGYLFENPLQVPANRVGRTARPLGRLKIMQEIITPSVFVPFAVRAAREPLKLDYLCAALCLVGAVHFMIRSP